MRKRFTGVGLVSMLGMTLVFGVLTALHAELGALAGLDHAVQAWVHGWPAWMLGGMLEMTGLGAVATYVPAVAFVLVEMVVRGDRRRAWLLGVAMAGALALNEGLKAHFRRARPGVAWAVGVERTYSFPSGHALFAMTLYGTLLWLAWRGASGGRRLGLGMVAGLMVAGIGVSRVYLGAHWPTDVLAGYAVGMMWVGTVMVIDRVWGQPRTW